MSTRILRLVPYLRTTMTPFTEALPGDRKFREMIFKTKRAQCHTIEKAAGHKQGATDRSNVPKAERKINLREKMLLLDFFRKQSQIDLSNALNHLQILLSKLIIFPGYCANDLNEEDWDFVLSMTRFWIRSAVVIMEDVVEDVIA